MMNADLDRTWDLPLSCDPWTSPEGIGSASDETALRLPGPALVDERDGHVVQATGRDAPLQDAARRHEPGADQLLGQHLGVGGRVDRVPGVTDHEGRGLDGAALLRG